MPDFRQSLYDRYVSDFKGLGPQPGGRSATWRARKLGPLLNGLDPAGSILELGCGDGHLLGWLADRGFANARGIDISAEQILLARDRGCNAVVADGSQYLADHQDHFDAILALDFVEHFHKEELVELSRAMFRALKPGGRLILQTPNGQGLLSGQVVFGDLTHLTIFTPNSLQQLLRRTGFRDFRFYETGPVPVGARGVVRTGLWRAIRTVAAAVHRIETGKSQTIWTENMISYCERPR